MRSFKKYLEERISDVVYHWTDLDAAISIILGNKFILRPSSADDEEQELSDKFGKGKKYFMSTARTRVSGYSVQQLEDGGMNFVLDGRELSKKFMGRSIDYYSSFRPNFKTTSGGYPREQEDRIFTDKKEIGNIQKYIKEVEIILPDIELQSMSKKDFTDLLGSLHRLSGQNVDYYIYTNIPDFKNKRKNKALTRKTQTKDTLKKRWSELRGINYE